MLDHTASHICGSVTSSSYNTIRGLVFPDQVESESFTPIAAREVQEVATHGNAALVETKSSSSDLGVTVWCRNLSYEVSGKLVLDNVTFAAQPGQLSVIMGPSGSGKTSLLTVLLDRVKAGKITGERNFNNQPVNASIVPKYTHFVPASDITHAYLTVRETLLLTCKLRCPHASRKDRQTKVDSVIKWMELQSCENTYVGGATKRGISKGQMKRLAIACGLLDNPAILVLDEPTSGLDSCLALDIIGLLSALAVETQKTIIASIHQPSHRAYFLFHSLTLMSCGRILYHGPAGEAVEYFGPYRKCGHQTSHPDYLLEIGTVYEQTFVSGGRKKVVGSSASSGDPESPTYSTPAEIQMLADKFVESKYQQETLSIVEAVSLVPVSVPAKKSLKRKSWTKEFRAIFHRSFLENSRNPLNFLVGLLVAALSSAMIGALFFLTATPTDNPDAPHRPISTWPIWYSDATIFLAKGLDKGGYDPFMDLIERGVGPDGRSIVLELPMRQDIIDWLPKVTKCLRDRYGETIIAAKKVLYPDYYWPAGSINRTGFAGMPADYPFATIAPEEIVNMLVQLLQILDFIVTGKWDQPIFQDIYDADVTFWADAVTKTQSYVDPLLCCLGMQWEYTTVSSSRCAASFPWPDPPEVGLGNYTNSVRRLFASTSSTNHDRQWWSKLLQQQQMLPKRALHRRSDGSLYTTDDKIFDHSKNLDKSSKILDNSSKNLDKISKNLDQSSKTLYQSSKRSPQRRLAPRRRLRDSGMSGIIYSIWKLMSADPDSALYGLITSLSEWAEKFDNCSTSYCYYIQETSGWIADEVSNIGNSFMAAINVAGLVFISTGNFAFLTLTALLSFHTDKAIFNRDTANGLYRPSSYFLAKLCSDVPFHAAINLVWAVVFYFMVGLPLQYDRMLSFGAIAILTGFVCASFGYFCASICSRVELAVIITPLLLLLQLTTSGMLLNEDNMPKPVAWLTYLSIFRYAQKALFTAILPPNNFFGSLDNNLLLTMFSVKETRCWIHCLCLLAHATVYRSLSFLAIKFFYRHHALDS